MKNEFSNCFYIMHRIVSIARFTNISQRTDEQLVDYINWRALSEKCKENLSESLAVKMCAQGMDWNR